MKTTQLRALAFCLSFIIASCGPSREMAIPVNPSTTPTFPATISPPQNGDNLDAQQLQDDVEVPLQNGVEAARLLTYGGGFDRRVKCTSNTNLVIQPYTVIATVGGIWTAVQVSTTATLNPTVLSAGLTANTRYHVYVYLTLGVPTYSVVTDAPTADYKYKNGDTSRMWLSTFYVDNASNIVTYSQTNQDFFYYSRTPIMGGAVGNLIYDYAVPFGGVVVNYGALVPTGANAVRLMALTAGNPVPAWGSVAESTIQYDLILQPSTTAQSANGQVTFSNNVTSCYLDVDANTTHMALWVVGFTL